MFLLLYVFVKGYHVTSCAQEVLLESHRRIDMSALCPFLLLLHFISAINILQSLQVVLVSLLLLLDIVLFDSLHGYLPLFFQFLALLLLALPFFLEVAEALLLLLVPLLVDLVNLLLLHLLVGLLVPLHLVKDDVLLPFALSPHGHVVVRPSLGLGVVELLDLLLQFLAQDVIFGESAAHGFELQVVGQVTVFESVVDLGELIELHCLLVVKGSSRCHIGPRVGYGH